MRLQSFTPSEEEAEKLLVKMSTVVELTEIQLRTLVDNKAHFESLKVAGLVKRNVSKTEAASKELSDLMIAKAPANIKREAEALEKRRAGGFAKATAAFEGATGGEADADAVEDSE